MDQSDNELVSTETLDHETETETIEPDFEPVIPTKPVTSVKSDTVEPRLRTVRQAKRKSLEKMKHVREVSIDPPD